MNCENCGTVLIAKQKRWCSHRCQSAGNMRKYRGGKRAQETRICVVCGKSFETSHPTKLYCSYACYVKSYRPNQVKKCEHCGKETTRRRYCSPECWAQARKLKIALAKKRFLATEKGAEYKKQRSRLNNHRRRKNFINSGERLTLADWKATLEYFDHKCAYCGEPLTKVEQDHFIPLSSGGNYTKNNILPACHACNQNKSDKNPIDWLAGLPNALIAYARITMYFMKVQTQ